MTHGAFLYNPLFLLFSGPSKRSELSQPLSEAENDSHDDYDNANRNDYLGKRCHVFLVVSLSLFHLSRQIFNYLQDVSRLSLMTITDYFKTGVSVSTEQIRMNKFS